MNGVLVKSIGNQKLTKLKQTDVILAKENPLVFHTQPVRTQKKRLFPSIASLGEVPWRETTIRQFCECFTEYLERKPYVNL